MKLEIHPAATLEYLRSIGWYERESEGLGGRFEKAILDRLELLLANPVRGTKRWRNYREIRVDGTFPFLIVFRHFPEEDLLYVSAIFHTTRHPRRKYRRRV